MLLNFDDDSPFATGVASYNYTTVPGSDDTDRILVQIEVDEELKEAILDTGGQYFFCTQELARTIAFGEALEDKAIKLRGQTVRGTLARVDIILIADEGEALPVEVTAFLPDAEPEFTAEFLPYSFLGLHACMDRIRFAVDPTPGEDKFYFGKQP
jgi:hypothetical protein